MYFKISMRYNPELKTSCGYYRLVESYRNLEGRVCHRTLLNIGFISHLQPEQLNLIQKQLTLRSEGKISILEEEDPIIKEHVEKYFGDLILRKRIDLPEVSAEKRKKFIDADTIKNKDVNEIGAEWMSYQALEQLKIKEFLSEAGKDEEMIQLTYTQIISRAIYPYSELRTSRWIKENSAICEITHYPIQKISKDKLYQNALNLYNLKDSLEQHLSKRTNELFDIQDKIVLYDLTNTYFEGEKRKSKLAKFGRSKEKRSDAKLIVLALVINPEGFIKYSNVFEGNTSDNTTLPRIIEKLRIKTSTSAKRALVVLDAGIATEENLELIQASNYDYICVSRSQLKDYKAVKDTENQFVVTKNKQKLTLQQVSSDKATDYYLMVKSPGKQLKESSMKTQFESRFELELEKIRICLSKKNTIKKADKIHQSIGRAIQKYPSVSKYYEIDVQHNNKGIATEISYAKNKEKYQQIIENLGVYFIRTNLQIYEEQLLWDVYNTIREIESSFRTLKTDLDLRPIYHKNDDATIAHLHLGLLAYWLVNTIRYQLKQKGINHNWQEIVRIANTQKIITTLGQNQDGDTLSIRRCSEPNLSIQVLYKALNYKFYPFIKRKSVVHSSEFKKNEISYLQDFTSD
jgi:hypothetical protein